MKTCTEQTELTVCREAHRCWEKTVDHFQENRKLRKKDRIEKQIILCIASPHFQERKPETKKKKSRRDM